MVYSQITDSTEIFAKIFSQNNIDSFDATSFLNEKEDHRLLRAMIVTLLEKQYPTLKRPVVDLQGHAKSPLEEALFALLTSVEVDYSRLNFFEKLIIGNLSFIFNCVDSSVVQEISESLIHAFSQKGEMLALFLLKEKDARSHSFLLLGYNLLDFATKSKMIEGSAIVCEKFYDALEKMEKSLESDLDILTESIYHVSRDFVRPVFEKDQGDFISSLFQFRQKSFDLLFSFTGENSGVGAFSFNHVKIVSFGPQVMDLGEIDKYGITFKPAQANHFIVEKKEGFLNAKGWGRLHGDPDTWIEHELVVSESFFDLKISFEKFRQSEFEISECFFVCAEEICVDGRVVTKNSLNRYKSIAQKVDIKALDELIEIDVVNGAICQIIPLAGSQHYWGADFIVAFEPESLKERMHLRFASKVF